MNPREFLYQLGRQWLFWNEPQWLDLSGVNMAYDPDQEESTYPQQGNAAGALGKSSHSLNLRKRIEVRISEYKREISTLEEIIKLLDENPAIEKFQNLSAKVRL